jgi:hypothetical protein
VEQVLKIRQVTLDKTWVLVKDSIQAHDPEIWDLEDVTTDKQELAELSKQLARFGILEDRENGGYWVQPDAWDKLAAIPFINTIENPANENSARQEESAILQAILKTDHQG